MNGNKYKERHLSTDNVTESAALDNQILNITPMNVSQTAFSKEAGKSSDHNTDVNNYNRINISRLSSEMAINKSFYASNLNFKGDIGINNDSKCSPINEALKISKFGSESIVIKVKNKISASSLRKRVCFLFLFFVIPIIILFIIFMTKKDFELDDAQIMKMNRRLSKFVPDRLNRFDSECTIERFINVKTKLRFIITKSNWFYCNMYTLNDMLCEENFYEDFNTHVDNSSSPLNHVLYNYIIGVEGDVIQGRPLTCVFDEPFFKDEYNSTVTIGIPYCFPGSSHLNNIVTRNVNKAISGLLDKLKEFNILSENYFLEVPDVCKDTLFSKELNRRNKVSFYNYHQYNNTALNPEIIRDLLFLPNENSTPRSLMNITHRDTWNPPKSLINSCQFVDPLHFQKINEILVVIDSAFDVALNTTDKNEILKNNTGCRDVSSCRNNILKMVRSDEKYNVQASPPNYFVFTSGLVFEGAPLNCSVFKNRIVIRVVFFEVYNSQLFKRNIESYILPLSKLIRNVVDDIRRIKNYTEVRIGQICNFVFLQNSSFDVLLRLVTDIEYVDSRITAPGGLNLSDICEGAINRKLLV